MRKCLYSELIPIPTRSPTGPITIAIRLQFDCVNESGCRHSMLLKARAAHTTFFLSLCRLQKK